MTLRHEQSVVRDGTRDDGAVAAVQEVLSGFQCMYCWRSHWRILQSVQLSFTPSEGLQILHVSIGCEVTDIRIPSKAFVQI